MIHKKGTAQPQRSYIAVGLVFWGQVNPTTGVPRAPAPLLHLGAFSPLISTKALIRACISADKLIVQRLEYNSERLPFADSKHHYRELQEL